MKKIFIFIALCALAVPAWAMRDFDFQDSVRVAGSITVYDTGATQSVIDSINRLISESLAVVIIDSALYADSSGVAKALTAQTFIRSTTCSTRVAWAESIKANGPLYLWSKADSIIALEAVHLRQDTVYSGNMVVRDTLDAAYADADTLLGKTVNKGVLEATDSVKSGTVVRAPMMSADSAIIPVVSARVLQSSTGACTLKTKLTSDQYHEAFFDGYQQFGVSNVFNGIFPDTLSYIRGAAVRDTAFFPMHSIIQSMQYGDSIMIDTIMLRYKKLNADDTIHFYLARKDSVGCVLIDSMKNIDAGSTGNLSAKLNSAQYRLCRRPHFFVFYIINKTAVTDIKCYWVRVKFRYY